MKTLDRLLDDLEELAYLEPNGWKSRAYRNARSVLMSKGEASFDRRKSWTDIPGIGKSINSKIVEFKSEGSISKLTKLRLLYPKKLNPKFYKVRKSYVTKRIDLKSAMELFNEVSSIIKVPEEDMTLCGSARRKEKLIGDLDIVINTTDKYLMGKLKDKLSKNYEVTVAGDKKLSFIIDKSTMTPVDIYITDPSTYFYMVLYLTGSASFGIKIRGKAKSEGYKLNQYGLFDKDGKSLSVNSEKDIFDKIGIPYVKPQDRS